MTLIIYRRIVQACWLYCKCCLYCFFFKPQLRFNT